jgi:hypothetical protein
LIGGSSREGVLPLFTRRNESMTLLAIVAGGCLLLGR